MLSLLLLSVNVQRISATSTSAAQTQSHHPLPPPCQNYNLQDSKVKKFVNSKSSSSNDLCTKYINNNEDKFVFSRRMKHNKIRRSISGPSSSSSNNSPKIIDYSSFDNNNSNSKKGFVVEQRTFLNDVKNISSFENINDKKRIIDNEDSVENISETNFRIYKKADTTTIVKSHQSDVQEQQSDRFNLLRDINGE